PEKQVAVDSYHSYQRRIGKIASIDGLAAKSLQVARAIDYWRQNGVDKPFLVEILSDQDPPERRYVGLLFPNSRVPWKDMLAFDPDRTQPYFTPGPGIVFFEAAGNLLQELGELQPPLTAELMAAELDAA
ncbi:MAG: hypothetical protein L0Y56_18130, partial [Nitrospira sp.]|nr:hypothetical protein [Nitrospira sp.]